MAKFGYIQLKVKKNGELVGTNKLNTDQYDKLVSGDVIYIYRGVKSKRIYIGQTKQFYKRNVEHYSRKEEHFNRDDFDEVIILYSSLFNGSALDDVENQLITYFTADNPETKKQKVFHLTNRTSGNSVNEYAGRERIASDVILPFWEHVLYKSGWVTTSSLKKIRIRELVKYSPIKTLTPEQESIINEIIHRSDENFVINGDAGTGKTVLLTHLVAGVLSEYPAKKIAVVVQPNWIKTAKRIFKVYGVNNKNLSIGSSTQIINSRKQYDLVIVDEAHKLSRRGNKQMASFNKVYKGEFAERTNHLEILVKISKQIVLMYDVLQAIRPANIPRSVFEKVTSNYEQRYLTTQFRIKASEEKNYTSDDYINGIKYLLYKDTGLLNKTNFDENFNREVFRDSSENAYFGYYENKPLKNLFEWIDNDRNLHPEHINRVLGGLVEEWRQSDGKDPNIMHWKEGDIVKRWNSTQENWINSKDEDAEEQIGSVFAVQGIDLNAVGVLIGNDLEVNSDGKLVGNSDNFKNINGKFSKGEQDKPDSQREFTLFVLNIYYVLLTRGIDGIRVGFWHNEPFKKYMKETLEIVED